MFYADKRFIYMLLAIIAILSLMNMTQIGWLSLLLTLPGVLIAITFHEFAHAYAATKLGDDTPAQEGRLNLNPLSHLDPIGFVLLLFVGFGWGKPVAINPRNFDRRYSQITGEAIVASAGPIMNFILAVVLTIIYCAMYKFCTSFVITEVGTIIVTIIQSAIIVNLGLGVFNLIPLPPLDGSKILVNFLPYNGRQWLYEHEHIFYIIFLALWITRATSYIITPILNLLYNGIYYVVACIFGLL